MLTLVLKGELENKYQKMCVFLQMYSFLAWMPLFAQSAVLTRASTSRDKSVSEILRCYPEMKSVNDSGKPVTEYSNKYWLMLSEAETALTYPEKTTQK